MNILLVGGACSLMDSMILKSQEIPDNCVITGVPANKYEN